MKTIKRAELNKTSKGGCYKFRVFRKLKAVAAFSTRRFRVNFTPEVTDSITIAHRKLFCQFVKVPFDKMICLEQVHGANIVKVGA